MIDRWISWSLRITTGMRTEESPLSRVVHLELHTPDRAGASAFYTQLLGWQPEVIRAESGCYLALDLAEGLGGGIVECGTRRPLWLPYVTVDSVNEATERARGLGAEVLLEPHEGLSGRRSVVSSGCAGDVALWEPRR
jgi:predicted enzyme related to lactoylglutathione lyase